MESLRNNAARFSKVSELILSRVTIALSRNWLPLADFIINSRATNRPIRPNPYNMTSFGSIFGCCLAPFNFFDKNENKLLLIRSSLRYSKESLPISNFEAGKFNCLIA